MNIRPLSIGESCPARKRFRRWVWRTLCRFSNPVLRIDHCLYSSRRATTVSAGGREVSRAFAYASLLGWGAVFHYAFGPTGDYVWDGQAPHQWLRKAIVFGRVRVSHNQCQ